MVAGGDGGLIDELDGTLVVGAVSVESGLGDRRSLPGSQILRIEPKTQFVCPALVLLSTILRSRPNRTLAKR